MKLHPLRVILLIAMAVDTLSVYGILTEHVIVDHLLVIVLQAPLVDG
jgi:hypothetical protein